MRLWPGARSLFLSEFLAAFALSIRYMFKPSSLSDSGLRLIAENVFGALRVCRRSGDCRRKGFGAGYRRWRAAIGRAPARYGLIRRGTQANIRLMFQAMVTRFHSPRAPLRPRSEN